MGEAIAWDNRLEVTDDGRGLVKDAGVVLLRKTAGVTGLTTRIAQAFGPGRPERMDRGTVPVSAAAAIAAGARNLSQVERLLAHHGGTFGACGSDSTLWRALDSVDDRRLRRLQTARRRARKTAWRQIAARPGGFPWLTIGGKHLDRVDRRGPGCHARGLPLGQAERCWHLQRRLRGAPARGLGREHARDPRHPPAPGERRVGATRSRTV